MERSYFRKTVFNAFNREFLMESDFLLVNDIIIRYNPAEITTNFTVLKHSLFYKFKLDTNANRKIR